MGEGAQPRARILVVDDDRMICAIVSDALAPLAEVETCESGEAALASLRRTPADLVITDLNLPRLSGIELLEVIQREQPGTECVLLTGQATVESAIGALRLGAADYLTKPIRPEALALVVERILARRRLLAENVRLREELDTVEACRGLLRCADAGQVYAVALDLVLKVLGGSQGFALYRSETLPGVLGLATRGFDDAAADALHRLALAEKIDLPEQLVTPQCTSQPPRLGEDEGVALPPGLAWVVPLGGPALERGWIWAFGAAAERNESELRERLALVARHADLALQNVERLHHAKERAFIDDVTEIYNVRYLMQAADHELQRSAREEKQLSVLFLDLDRFKLVNDRFGHLVGSDVLRQLSRVLEDSIRRFDTVARYGGDEFTILLVGTGLEAALQIAERIRERVAQTRFEGTQGSPIQLSVSIGVAAFPDHASERDTLLDLADKAMYRAKSRGRNCVCSAADLLD